MEQALLTTIDNPFDPFTQFDDWFAFDTQMGYHTCSLLDRIAKVPENLGEVEEERFISLAMDEIIKYDPSGLYVKVSREIAQKLVS